MPALVAGGGERIAGGKRHLGDRLSPIAVGAAIDGDVRPIAPGVADVSLAHAVWRDGLDHPQRFGVEPHLAPDRRHPVLDPPPRRPLRRGGGRAVIGTFHRRKRGRVCVRGGVGCNRARRRRV